jgi:hypothetical protein
VSSCYKNCDEISGSIEREELVGQLTKLLLLKMDSTQ